MASNLSLKSWNHRAGLIEHGTEMGLKLTKWCVFCVPGWHCQRQTAFRERVTNSNRWSTSRSRGASARHWSWVVTAEPPHSASSPSSTPARTYIPSHPHLGTHNKSQLFQRKGIMQCLNMKGVQYLSTSPSQSEWTSEPRAWWPHRGKPLNEPRGDSEDRKCRVF